MKRFPSAYQLLCIQAVNSFIVNPLDWDSVNLQFGADEGNWQEVQKTGKCFPCSGGPSPGRQTLLREGACAFFKAVRAGHSGAFDMLAEVADDIEALRFASFSREVLGHF